MGSTACLACAICMQEPVLRAEARTLAATYTQLSISERQRAVKVMLSQLGAAQAAARPPAPQLVPIIIDLETSGYSPSRNAITEVHPCAMILLYTPTLEYTVDCWHAYSGSLMR